MFDVTVVKPGAILPLYPCPIPVLIIIIVIPIFFLFCSCASSWFSFPPVTKFSKLTRFWLMNLHLTKVHFIALLLTQWNALDTEKCSLHLSLFFPEDCSGPDWSLNITDSVFVLSSSPVIFSFSFFDLQKLWAEQRLHMRTGYLPWKSKSQRGVCHKSWMCCR